MDVLGILSRDEQMRPNLAVMLYSGGGDTMATINPVLPDPATGEPLIYPGDCMSRAHLEELAISLSGGNRKRQALPANVLVAEAGIIAWWTPVQRRPIFFATRTDFDAEANAKHALHPALLFVGRPRGLTVYALAENDRPGDATRLLRAPYYNLEGHGAMCRGTVPMPESTIPASIPAYERAFFDSSFVHTGMGNQDLCRHPGGHNGLWKDLIAIKGDAFPVKHLIPLLQGDGHMTLEMAINL